MLDFFFFKQKTAYEIKECDWSSDVCSSDLIFERQIEALGKPGDVSIGFTTSGRSNNVVRAQGKAKDMGLKTIAFIGSKPSSLSEICDVTFSVPSDNTARVQEGHILVGHILCHCVEQSLFHS